MVFLEFGLEIRVQLVSLILHAPLNQYDAKKPHSKIFELVDHKDSTPYINLNNNIFSLITQEEFQNAIQSTRVSLVFPSSTTIIQVKRFILERLQLQTFQDGPGSSSPNVSTREVNHNLQYLYMAIEVCNRTHFLPNFPTLLWRNFRTAFPTSRLVCQPEIARHKFLR